MKRNDSDNPNKKEAASKPAPALTWARLVSSPSLLISVIFNYKMPQKKPTEEVSPTAPPLQNPPKAAHKYAKEARDILTAYGSFPKPGASPKKGSKKPKPGYPKSKNR